MLRCLIINPPFANHSHGTGKQLQYFVQDSGLKCYHLCWDSRQPLGDEPCHYINLYRDWASLWPIATGRGTLLKWQTKLNLKWWDNGRFSRRTKVTLNRIRKLGIEVAYVIVASDEEAAVACKILAILGIPYVVNWMDLAERSPVVATATHASIASLNGGAARVFALTSKLARVIGRSSKRDVSILQIGRPLPKERAKPPILDQPLRCVMLGSVLNASLGQLWPAALKLVRSQGVAVDLYYVGRESMLNMLPAELPVKYLGALSDSERDRSLSTMHLAILPGPDADPSVDCVARYSFPSRIADYLHHGLPIVGSVHPDSATAEQLHAIIGVAVWLSASPEMLSARIVDLAKGTDVWGSASQSGVEFARRHFASTKITKTLVGSLFVAARKTT